MSSCCDYIIQSELKKNIKRLLKGSGYLHDILLPKIEETIKSDFLLFVKILSNKL